MLDGFDKAVVTLAYCEYEYSLIFKMYRFSFFVVDMQASDPYSPLHDENETRKL